MLDEESRDTSYGENFFILEGEVTEFHVASTTVNLLSKIEKNLEEKVLVGGLAAAANGMYGALANSAMLSLYDGEDMYNFAAVVNGEIVCGVFEDANKIKDGDIVKMVVAKKDVVLYVHSLVRLSDSLFMMPLNTYCGKRAFFWECMKIARNMVFFVWVFAYATLFFYVEISEENRETVIKFCLILFVSPMLFCFPFEYWSFKTMSDYSIYAGKIFSAYGVPRPDDFSKRLGVTVFKDQGLGFIGYSYELALLKHRKKFNISSV